MESHDLYDGCIVNGSTTLNYINRFRALAILEYQYCPLLPSIKMAQAILESDSNRSRLSRSHKNHFGIRSFNTKSKYKSFSNDSDSWRYHSKILMNDRYSEVLDAKGIDNQLSALSKSGYATDHRYISKLKRIIETYNLSALDNRL